MAKNRQDAIREAYDRAAEAYAEKCFFELYEKPLDRKLYDLFFERTVNRGPVLEIGCGPGEVSNYLWMKGKRRRAAIFSRRKSKGRRSLPGGLSEQRGHDRAVGIGEIVTIEIGGGDPAELLVLAFLHGPGRPAGLVRLQPVRPAAVREIGAGDEPADDDLDAELLPQLPRQAGPLVLSRLELAARELPFPGEIAARAALGDEHGPVLPNDGGGDDLHADSPGHGACVTRRSISPFTSWIAWL
jgi:hypothetical protein